MVGFSEIFVDSTKFVRKIKKSDYLDSGIYPIIDQGQEFVIGYTNDEKGLYNDVPAIIFGDHTRIIKYIDKPFFIGADGVKVLKTKIDDVDYKYLYYALRNIDIINTGYNRHFKWLKESKIKLPDIKKQQEIATILDSIENIVNLKNMQLQEYDQLIKSRFVEMFGDPKINNKRFPLVKPEEICESISAGGDRPNEVSSIRTEEFLYPIFSNGEKDDGLYGWSKGYRIEKPAVTISGRGTIGYTSFRKDGKFTPIVRLIVMIPNEKVNPIYLTYYMNLEREIGSGSGVQQLTVPMIKEKSIILPDIVDQNYFALLVEQIDKLKFEVQKSLNETQMLFDSLMQEYFG